jgi:hypothetical protein
MADHDERDDPRVSSGWGARPPRPVRDPYARDRRTTGAAEPSAAPREPAGAADAPGGVVPPDGPGDDRGPEENPEENLAQDEPLSGNPPPR